MCANCAEHKEGEVIELVHGESSKKGLRKEPFVLLWKLTAKEAQNDFRTFDTGINGSK